MTKRYASEVIEELRRAVLHADAAGGTDGQLLERFVAAGDPAALAALVRRHGPMVWGVCCRALGRPHDAEDAFQATFLVLARRAASVRPREAVGNWLYGVAHQTARKARATLAKRAAREKQVAALPEPATTDHDSSPDLRPLLDQELARLPDKYRSAVVLCDLEGKTRQEAARALGLPEGTVASRLARARAQLARRLARYGLAVSGAALAAELARAAAAEVPAPLLGATVVGLARFAAGTAAPEALSAQVAALTESVVNAMLLTRLKIALAVLAAALLGTAAVSYAVPTPGPAGPTTAPERPPPAPRGAAPAPAGPAAKKVPASADSPNVIEEWIPDLREDAGWRRKPALHRVQSHGMYSGFRFRYPFAAPGAAHTFLVDKAENRYVWPPKVDPATANGRTAIYQALRDAHRGEHFTMDGDQLLVFGGARLVPFTFADERVRQSFSDIITRVPVGRFAETAGRRFAAAKRTAGPIDGSYVLPLPAETNYFLALTEQGSVVFIDIRRQGDCEYSVGYRFLKTGD